MTNVVDFGLFVELADGLEGLVHISDFSWAPLTETPQDLYQVGQEIEVMVLDIDAERGRANLGIKQLQEDETSTQILEYSVGQVLDAKVTGIQSYGVFAELTPGLEGMIHISELGEDGEDPGAVLSLNDVVRVEITAIDVDEKRISLRRALNGEVSPDQQQTAAAGDADEDAVADVAVDDESGATEDGVEPPDAPVEPSAHEDAPTTSDDPENAGPAAIESDGEDGSDAAADASHSEAAPDSATDDGQAATDTPEEKTLRTTVLSCLAKNALGTSRCARRPFRCVSISKSRRVTDRFLSKTIRRVYPFSCVDGVGRLDSRVGRQNPSN